MSGAQRRKTGCWTCRLRRKKCNEDGQPCSNCEARGVFCHGYGPKPSWKDRGEREREEAQRLQLISRARTRRARATTINSINDGPRRPSIDMNTSDMGSPIQMGLASSDSSILESSSLDLLDIPELGSSLWDPTLDIIQVQHPPSEPPSALQFPSILGDGLEEKEIDLIMYYVVEVFPRQHSSYQGTSVMERSWLLCVLKRSSSFYYTSLSLSAHYRLMSMPEDGQGRTALLQEYERYKTCSLFRFQELVSSAARPQSLISTGVVGESVICGVQIAMLEAVSKNMQSSYLHLSSAALSLAQLLDNTSALDSNSVSTNTTPQSSVLTTGLYHAGSMEYKALRCFSIILIWNDILHCSAQQSIPAAAKTYQKLLADESFISLFVDIVGCEGWVLVPILEAMLLASWKKDQEAKGQLSIRELLTKVDHIESILGDRMKRLAPAVLRQKEAGISSQSPEQIRLVHTYIFAHASFVHLHTVASGAQPSVPEIQQSIDKSLAAWQLLPPSLINFKTMAWPFCVCGSMAVGPQRGLFQKIMSENFGNQSTSTNLHCLKSVIEECWKNFDKRVPEQSPSSYNWKIVMEKLNLSILFI
ncbi:ustiloxin B cluster transcription factor ustR [Aspergillus parasiticus]